ncbi:SAM-dependent methyltransferase [Nonomuraea lactucae]|uniref:SAM-dependent methyltransferase n=1 Tax=Nonomuraea lactucae TaxID=2249762 RepID=UPI001F05308A|nr:SAM-dependent methyltransferase [Nonomuraea lactucae]
MAKLNTGQARITRMLDAAAGGKNNFVADREAVRRYDEAGPVTTAAARAVLDFLARVVRHLAACGIEQFLIIGSGVPSGLPAGHQLHDIARQAPGRPGARVLYVESDPMVLANAQATIEPVTDLVRVVEGDAAQVEDLLADRVVRTFIDWDRPVGMLLVATYGVDDEEASHVIKCLCHAAARGSYLGLLQTTFDGIPPELLPAIQELLAMTLPGHVIRSREEVAALLEGLDLVEPGLVWVTQWRPDGQDPAWEARASTSGNYGAVARLL